MRVTLNLRQQSVVRFTLGSLRNDPFIIFQLLENIGTGVDFISKKGHWFFQAEGKWCFSKSGNHNGILLGKPYMIPENPGVKNTGTNVTTVVLEQNVPRLNGSFPKAKLHICTDEEWATPTNFKPPSFTNIISLYQIAWVGGVASEDWAFYRATMGNGMNVRITELKGLYAMNSSFYVRVQ